MAAKKSGPKAATPKDMAKTSSAPPNPVVSVAAEDDTKIIALDLPRGELSDAMKAYFAKCDEKLGFVPNV